MNSPFTSTPLINSYKSGSLPASPSNSRLTPNLRSPKYLIASPNYGTVRRPSDRGGSPMIMNSTVNVSLYTNTQSPGLASRIVQYDRAQNGRSPTHNRKFGSPGFFPIVHLNKKNMPEVSPRPKKVTVKIAPPDDLSMYNHVDHSIIISENARITTFSEHNTHETEGTRSVLDALKEISRKRIHSAAVEFETSTTSPEIGNKKRNKRILESTSNSSSTNSLNTTPQFNNYKRVREESPPDVNSLSQSTSSNISTNTVASEKPNTKRYCSIDPITASFTSANLRFKDVRKAAVRTIEEVKEDLPDSPLRKVQTVSVDTQTIEMIDLSEETVEKPPTEEINNSNYSKASSKTTIDTATVQQLQQEEEEEVQEMPLFDPRPLEIIRRNKLATLLAAINGEKPVLEKLPSPTLSSVPPETIFNNINIPQTIQNGEPAVKHVSFDIPPHSTTAVTLDVPCSNPTLPTTLNVQSSSNPNITQTTTALVMPISSTMIVPPSAPIGSTSFLTGANIKALPPSIGNSQVTGHQNSLLKPVGGFKFDLKPSSHPQSTTSIVSNSFNFTPALTIQQPFSSAIQPISAPTTMSNEVVPSSGIQFGSNTLKLPEEKQQNTFSAISNGPPVLSFGLSKQPVGSINAPIVTTTNAVVTPSFNFGAIASTTAVNFVAPANSAFSFGGSNTTTTSVVPISTSSLTIQPAFSFTATATPTLHVLPKLAPPGLESTVAPLFGGTTLTTTNMFGKPSATSSPFHNAAVPAITTAGYPSTASPSTTKFGQLSGTNSLFGTTTANATATTFSFGGSSCAIGGGTISSGSIEKAAAIPTFGAVVTTTGPSNSTIFGAASPFAPITAGAANKSGNTFGAFGGQKPESKFGQTAVAAVAANNPTVTTTSTLFNFGSSVTTTSAVPPNMFGGSTNTTAASVPTFGAPKLTTFGGFSGSTAATNNAFGGSEVPPNRTVQPQNPNPPFSFGGGGTSFDTFNKPAPSFEPVSTFGGQQLNNNSAFNTATPSFGAQQPQQSSKLFTFGTATATPKAADPLASAADKPSSSVFAFGGSTTAVAKPQQPTAGGGFNFSAGGGTANTAFGAPNGVVPSFGAPNNNPGPVMFGAPQGAPSFNVGGSFNAPGLVGGSGMFSIGSGSSSGTGRPRTQLKAKRRP